MRLSEKPRVAGLVIGLVVGAASWAGNAARTNLGIIWAFPDLLTVAALPLATYFFVRARLRAAHPPDLRSVRRSGWSVVNTAAIVLAVFLASVAGFWFNQLDRALVTSTLVGAVVVTIGVGYASVEVWARLLLGVHEGEHR
jgi:hypothetical protein